MAFNDTLFFCKKKKGNKFEKKKPQLKKNCFLPFFPPNCKNVFEFRKYFITINVVRFGEILTLI